MLAVRPIQARRPFIAALCGYALAVALMYASVVFLGRTILPAALYPRASDGASAWDFLGGNGQGQNIDLATAAYYEMPLDRVVGESYRHGRLPLWLGQLAAGHPLIADYSTRALFPYQMLQDVAPTTCWDFFFLGRAALMGFFTFCFLFQLGLHWEAAFLGGLCYLGGGPGTWFLTTTMVSNPAMTLPVLLLSAEAYLRKPSSWRFALHAAAYALVFLAGQPEVAAVIAFLCCAFMAFRLAAEPFRGRARRLGWRVAAAPACGLCLAAPQVLPFLELSRVAFHQHYFSALSGPGAAVVRFEELVGVLFPKHFVGPAFDRKMPVNGFWDDLGGYTGLSEAVLIGLGLLADRGRSRLLLFFTAFGLALLGKLFGFILTQPLGSLPILGAVWFPRWSGCVWVFSLACAAALSAQALCDAGAAGTGSPLEGVARWPRWLGGFAALVVATGLLRIAGFSITPSRPASVTGFSFAEHWRAIAAQSLAGLILPVGLVFLAGAASPRGKRERAALLLFFIGACAAGELIAIWGFDSWDALGSRDVASILARPLAGLGGLACAFVMFAVARSVRRGGIPLAALIAPVFVELWWLVPRDLTNRGHAVLEACMAMGLLGAIFFAGKRTGWACGAAAAMVACAGWAQALWARNPRTRAALFSDTPEVAFLRDHVGTGRIYGVEGALEPNESAAYGLDDVRFQNSLGISRYLDFVKRELWSRGHQTWTPLWFTGIQEKSLDGAAIAPDPVAEFIERLPGYSLAGVKFLVVPRWDERAKTMLLKAGLRQVFSGDDSIFSNPFAFPRAFLSGDPPVPADSISISADGETRVSVDAASPSLLEITDVVYPGWTASLNGAPAEIVPVDGTFCGIRVPAGKSEVVLSYKPRSFWIGLAAAGLMALLLLSYALLPLITSGVALF